MFSFLTDIGVYTPTRVLMGGTDSVAYCQSSVQEMFADELYRCLQIWLDDLLGYSKTKEGLLAALERVLKTRVSRAQVESEEVSVLSNRSALVRAHRLGRWSQA
ncbi:hypothetical protein AeNC1_017662 [Aphanomyces euteiches]|nr:hypothetical protein AeNC1_017662 [Aphanomyces euteiches]